MAPDVDPPWPPGNEAVGAAAVVSHVTHGPRHSRCQNCRTALQGPYCHACGQHEIEYHRGFGHVMLVALENFFPFDAKFFRDMRTLLFRPGKLGADCNAGERASRLRPFRPYLFISVLDFFVPPWPDGRAVRA